MDDEAPDSEDEDGGKGVVGDVASVVDDRG